MGFEKCKPDINKNNLYEVLFYLSEMASIYYSEAIIMEQLVNDMKDHRFDGNNNYGKVKELEHTLNDLKNEISTISYLSNAYKDRMGKDTIYMTLARKTEIKNSINFLWKGVDKCDQT